MPVADQVQLCKEEGRWPELVRIAHVMLLDKGGKPVDKLQARPITVLPRLGEGPGQAAPNVA